MTESTTTGKDLPSGTGEENTWLNQPAALEYWSSVSADNDGVLGGFPQVSRADIRGSKLFISRLRNRSTTYSSTGLFERVVDCGAGIGRVTKSVLIPAAEKTDVVEPVQKFTDVVSGGEEFAEWRDKGRVGDVYTVTLQEWEPEHQYDLIWNQWCLCQLTDVEVVDYLTRVKRFLKKGGWIVAKENLSTFAEGRDQFESIDNSVTRSDEKFQALFVQAGLKVVYTVLQKGFPVELYPVRMYALQPATP